MQSTEVHYFIKQLSEGDYFGLEELIEIGLLKFSGQEGKKDQVKRKLRVSTVENCKLLYMTSKSFFRLFGEMEINKLKDFMEHIDLKEIETRVKSTWQFKKMMQKQVLGVAIERNT